MNLRSALFLAALAALPPAVSAALPEPAVVSSTQVAAMFTPNGDRTETWPLEGRGLGSLFDGDATTGVYLTRIDAGGWLLLDFSQAAPGGYHLTELSTSWENAFRYSVWTSTDGSIWFPVEAAQNASHAGTAVWPLGVLATQVKIVFEENTGRMPALAEVVVKGFVPNWTAVKVSNKDIAAMYNPDGTMTANNGTGGFGGGAGIQHLFDGNKKTHADIWSGGGGTWLPNLDDGGWCLLDFSESMPNGWFVTSISISQCSLFDYSLYWSDDGTTWHPVENAIKVSKVGEAVYLVNRIATHIKVFLNETGGWSVNLAEIEVWALNPDEIPCLHPGHTDWAVVPELSDSCTDPAIDRCFCTACRTPFYREEDEPAGHLFSTTLVRPGIYKAFGSGNIACSRCDWELDFPEPRDLITNKVLGTRIGRVSVKGQINFTDVAATSTGNSSEEPDPNDNWGVEPGDLIDDNWTWSWNHYWYARLPDDQHVDFVFGTEIDLAWIDVSAANATHTNWFFRVDDETGEETRLKKFRIERTDETTGDKWHIYRTNDVAFVYGDGWYDELPVVKDDGIPAYRTNPDGSHPMHQKVVDKVPQWEDEAQTIPVMEPDGNNDNQYQRFTVRFFECPVKHLRVRQAGLAKMSLSELHPWGTVRGAGDRYYRYETLVILR